MNLRVVDDIGEKHQTSGHGVEPSIVHLALELIPGKESDIGLACGCVRARLKAAIGYQIAKVGARISKDSAEGVDGGLGDLRLPMFALTKDQLMRAPRLISDDDVHL